jgi:hypothetical protein
MKYRFILLIPICFTLPGCVHLGEKFEQHSLPPGTPAAADILADLAENDNAIHAFRATGKFTLKSPDLETIHVLRQSSMAFEAPARLAVTGRKMAGITVLRLWCYGPEFLLEFPTENEFYYQTEGEAVAGAGFRVSPSDIAREMFLPENWDAIAPKEVRILAYDPDTRTAELVLLSGGMVRRPRRRLLVRGAPWIVLESIRLNAAGEAIAITRKEEYRKMDGVRFPARIETDFPLEPAWMHFELRRIYVNSPPDSPFPDLESRAAELAGKGYTAVTPVRNGGAAP